MDSTRVHVVIGVFLVVLISLLSGTIGFALGKSTSANDHDKVGPASLSAEKPNEHHELSELSDADRKSIKAILGSMPDRPETEEEKLAYAFKKAALSLSIGRETFQPAVAEEMINRHLAHFEFNRESESLTRYEGESGFARVRVNVAPTVRDVLLCYTQDIHERNVSHYLDLIGNGFGESGIGERVIRELTNPEVIDNTIMTDKLFVHIKRETTTPPTPHLTLTEIRVRPQ